MDPGEQEGQRGQDHQSGHAGDADRKGAGAVSGPAVGHPLQHRPRGQRLFAFIRIIDALNSRFRARILFLLSHLSISFCLGIGFSKNIDRYFLSPIPCTLFPLF